MTIQYSGPPLIRPPLGNGKSGFKGWPLARGILSTIIQSLFSEIMAS